MVKAYYDLSGDGLGTNDEDGNVEDYVIDIVTTVDGNTTTYEANLRY